MAHAEDPKPTPISEPKPKSEAEPEPEHKSESDDEASDLDDEARDTAIRRARWRESEKQKLAAASLVVEKKIKPRSESK